MKIINYKGRTKTLSERFWSKVDKTSICWNWTGSLSKPGYGIFGIGNKKTSRAHRVSWVLFHGEIKNNLFVLHKCDNRKCVNPNHLFLGTQLENIKDMDNKGRRVALTGIRNGEKHPLAKLNQKQVNSIKKQYNKGNITQKELGNKYEVCFQTISLIVNNKRWNK